MRLVIADDHPLFLEGVSAVLGVEPGVVVVGQARSAGEAIRVCADQQPDLVLMDIDMPGDSISAVRSIGEVSPASKVVMLTVSEDTRHIFGALKAGAHGYVLKGVGSRELMRIVRAVCEGESYVTATLAARILSEMAGDFPKERLTDELLEALSERETQILRLIGTGSSNKEIGRNLNLSEKTVKQYVTNILQKLHLRNRVEAAVLATQRSGQAGTDSPR